MNIEEVGAAVNERLQREPVGEVLNTNTVDDGHGHFITTAIYRSEPVEVRQGFDSPKVLIDTRYAIFINGQMQSAGGTEAEWSDGDA